MVRDGHQDARWRTHERKGTSNTCAVYRLKASGLHILTKKKKERKSRPYIGHETCSSSSTMHAAVVKMKGKKKGPLQRQRFSCRTISGGRFRMNVVKKKINSRRKRRARSIGGR